MNFSYSGEFLNFGMDLSLIGTEALDPWPDRLAVRAFEGAGVVPIKKLGGLQFLKTWVNYWKSRWPSFLISINSKISWRTWNSGKL